MKRFLTDAPDFLILLPIVVLAWLVKERPMPPFYFIASLAIVAWAYNGQGFRNGYRVGYDQCEASHAKQDHVTRAELDHLEGQTAGLFSMEREAKQRRDLEARRAYANALPNPVEGK